MLQVQTLTNNQNEIKGTQTNILKQLNKLCKKVDELSDSIRATVTPAYNSWEMPGDDGHDFCDDFSSTSMTNTQTNGMQYNYPLSTQGSQVPYRYPPTSDPYNHPPAPTSDPYNHPPAPTSDPYNHLVCMRMGTLLQRNSLQCQYAYLR